MFINYSILQSAVEVLCCLINTSSGGRKWRHERVEMLKVTVKQKCDMTERHYTYENTLLVFM